MTWHPITLGLWLLDLLSWLVYLSAAGRLFAALPGWRPDVCDRHQLAREHRLDLAALQGRWLFALQGFYLLLLVAAVTSVWPVLVPGAMCGTGVMQAMGISGYQAIVWRVAVVGCLAVWSLVAGMNAQDPRGRSAVLSAKLLLPVGPLLFAAGLTLARALAAVRPDHPVSCCSLVYDRTVLAGGSAAGASCLPPSLWVTLALGGWVLPAIWGYRQWRCPLCAGLFARLFFAIGVFCWLWSAVASLKWWFANYIFEVLSHPCLWCLFLPEHHLIGFALFGLAVWAAHANFVVLIAGILGNEYSYMRTSALDRTRRAGLALMASSTGFLLLAGAPAILWRFRFGGWM